MAQIELGSLRKVERGRLGVYVGGDGTAGRCIPSGENAV